MSKTRLAVMRPLMLLTFILGTFLSRPNLGPTPVVAASVVPSTTVETTETKENKAKTREEDPYSYPDQCVYRAWELAAEAGHPLPKWGNAAGWKQAASKAGYTVVDTLSKDSVGSVAVWDPGVGGASWYGHVGWVTRVDGNRFFVQDRNWIRGTDDSRWVEWQKGISFIILEDEAPEQPKARPAAAPNASEAPKRAPAAGKAQAAPERQPQNSDESLMQAIKSGTRLSDTRTGRLAGPPQPRD